jgi:DNA-binding NarL/FixJ family response regulator
LTITDTDTKIKTDLARMKMLLVEDSTLLRDVLVETIANIQHVTVADTAATQQQAINLLDSSQFDIVLLDIELAQGNGFEVLKHIQHKNYLFKAPIVMMLTNHAHAYYRSLADDLAVQYFFDKSMDFDMAMSAIEFEAAKFLNNKQIN